jgi:ribosomal protein S18 acetylase RimI-like enzyme
MTTPLSIDVLSRIEDAGLNASAPPQQLWVDGWLVRLSPGKAKRARCINAVAPGRLSVEDKLNTVTALYRDAQLPLIFRLTPFTEPKDLDARLDALGWRRFDHTLVMLCDMAQHATRDPLPAHLHLQPVGPQAFAQAIGQLRGSTPDQQQAHARRLAASPVPYRGVLVLHGEQLLACGQTAREGDRVGIYDVFTAPDARNQGMAGALCAAMLQHSAHDGARIAYLQVDMDNLPARAVYQRLGFQAGYDYHYRSPDLERA